MSAAKAPALPGNFGARRQLVVVADRHTTVWREKKSWLPFLIQFATTIPHLFSFALHTMAWLIWFSYTTGFFLCMLTAMWPTEPNGDQRFMVSGDIVRGVEGLGHLCVDNVRTQSWWTYTVCLKRSVVQVHLDPRTKTVSDRIQLGEYVPAESAPTEQVYRTREATCAVDRPDGTVQKVQRTTTVNIQCCDVIVHQMRQSRHTNPEKYAAPSASGDGVYWVPGQVALEAAEELRGGRGSGGSGYKGAPSTATTEAYISGVEESEPCTYDITVCSDLVCEPSAAPTIPAGRLPDASSSAVAKGATRHPVVTTAGAATAAEDPAHAHLAATADSAADPSSATAQQHLLPAAARIAGAEVSPAEQAELRERARQMFYHGYDSYMNNAFPEAELNPISCTGGKFDLIKIPLVTLIDTLDTLVILGNHSEFRRAVGVVTDRMPNFNMDVNVSVFETTIRILGGLLSAHLMAIDPKLAIYEPGQEHPVITPYDGRLLDLAVDLGERLMPAFETKTSIPYGTVNLLYGVPQGETKIASTAGAGSLLLEFQVLSYLSGQGRFGEAAYAATKGLFQRKSPIGLLGKHINTETGQWSESLSGVGSNADSFYEYLLKSYLLFRDKELFGMFSDTYRAIKRFVMVNDQWFTEVDMFSGKLQRKRVENLDAFWPGVEAMLGFTGQGADQLNTFYSVWQDLGFLPEEIDYTQWQAGKGAINGLYPLRPELIESTYHQYRTTGDRSWLMAGRVFLESIESFTHTSCGYATVTDVSTMALADTMPSFFLSETCKYLFLLFDEDNFVNHRPYIFSTEAHPFESTQVHFGDVRGFAANTSSASGVEEGARVSAAKVTDGKGASAVVPAEAGKSKGLTPAAAGEGRKRKKRRGKADASISILEEAKRHQQSLLQSLKTGAHAQVLPVQALQQLLQSALPTMAVATVPTGDQRPSTLPLKCRRPRWLDRSTSFDAEFLQEVNSNMRNEEFKGRGKTQGRKNSVGRERLAAQRAGKRRPLRLLNRPAAPQLSHSAFVVVDLITELHQRQANGTALGDHISKLKWYQVPSHMFHTERCQPGDQPSKQKAVNKNRSPTAPPVGTPPAEPAAGEALKTVKVTMGPLGEFEINVYADGFFIHNEQDDSQVEISNVGRTLVLVRESVGDGSAHSKVLMANTDQRTITTCRVQVHADEVSESASSGSGEMRARAKRQLFDRPCSVANFGPTLAGEPLEFAAQRVLLPASAPGSSSTMCEAPRQAQSSGGGGDKSAAWWPWTVLQYLGSGPDAGKASDVALDGPASALDAATMQSANALTVAVADRGDCLFEDKASNARKAGAQALIIRNNEEAVFIMAGKRDTENAEASVPEAEIASEKETPLTVMLSKDDGAAFAEVVQGGSGGSDSSSATVQPSTTVSIKSDVAHMLLNTEIMGNTDFPKIYLQRKLILVVGSGRWATLLKATKGEDWQLYLMSKEDVYLTHTALSPPHVVETKGGQRKTLPHTVLGDPLRLYAHTLARKCPTIVKSVHQNVVQV